MTQYAILTDLNRCVSCLACVVACKQANDVPIGNYWLKVLRIGPNLKEGATAYPDVEMYYLPMSCQHCENPLCVHVCPTGASAKKEDGTVQVDKQKCIGCQFCVMACPYGVRYLNEVQGVVEKCTLCEQITSEGHGLENRGDKIPRCVYGCQGRARWFGDLDKGLEDFQGTLKVDGETNYRLMEELPEKEMVIKPFAREACGRAVDPSKVIELICLSRIEESLLFSCMVAGAETILLVHGECKGCAREQGIATMNIVKESCDTLMAAWSLDQEIVLTEHIPQTLWLSTKNDEVRGADNRSLSRRDFFRGLTQTAGEAAANIVSTVSHTGKEVERSKMPSSVPVHVMADGTLPHFVPNRRERLLDKLDLLGIPKAESINTRLWGHIVLEEGLCSSCRMCATFCPTGAIYKFDDADGSFGIEHYMAECVNCRLCEDICPEQALSCVTTVPVMDLVEGRIERHVMKPLRWQPNRGDSIWRKMQQLIPDANINERC